MHHSSRPKGASGWRKHGPRIRARRDPAARPSACFRIPSTGSVTGLGRRTGRMRICSSPSSRAHRTFPRCSATPDDRGGAKQEPKARGVVSGCAIVVHATHGIAARETNLLLARVVLCCGRGLILACARPVHAENLHIGLLDAARRRVVNRNPSALPDPAGHELPERARDKRCCVRQRGECTRAFACAARIMCGQRTTHLANLGTECSMTLCSMFSMQLQLANRLPSPMYSSICARAEEGVSKASTRPHAREHAPPAFRTEYVPHRSTAGRPV